MKKEIKLPTVLGLIVLVFGVAAGLYLSNFQQVFKLGAQYDASPKNVRISNITDSSITVSWTTDNKTKGFIKWGQSKGVLSKVSLDEAPENSFVHLVNIQGIEKNTEIFFQINSNGTDYLNDGIPWQSKTLEYKEASQENLIGSGVILEPDGATPSISIVYLSINGNLLSTISSSQGSWILPISSYIPSVAETTAIEMTVIGSGNTTSSALIYPKFISSTPAIVLGKTYDFRNMTEEQQKKLPQSSVSIPESVEKSSRFEVIKSGSSGESTVVSLDSIDEGEIISTQDPEFFGSAPANTNIEIVVHSEEQTATVTSSNSGNWKWSPPQNLEPGEHSVTIKWKDISGITKTITRTFVVQASEGPAFVSTPSASLTPNPSQTPTTRPTQEPTILPTYTPVASITPIPTNNPVPETGSLTPTIGLFIMGIGILLSSIYIWKKDYV